MRRVVDLYLASSTRQITPTAALSPKTHRQMPLSFLFRIFEGEVGCSSSTGKRSYST